MELILNDCLLELNKFKKSGREVDYTFTSPPYNRKRNDKYEKFIDINENWYEMNCKIIDVLLKITKKHIFYNLQTNYYNRADVYKIIGKYSNQIKDIHIWEKTNPMPASGHNITNAVEYFIVLGDKPLKANKTYTKNIISSSVNSKMPKEHKAVMKQEISDYFIERFTSEGETILDPFMGVGTTGISCIKNNRKFIGIEINNYYYEMALEKLKEIEVE